MTATARAAQPYRALTDQALEREASALQRKIESLRWSSTTITVALLHEFRKRLDQVRAEVERRRT